MSKIKVYILILINIVFVSVLPAQSLCSNCECEEEASTSAEDTNFNSDIGGESADMEVGEVDMLGTEAGEEAGVEIGSEIGTEIGAEVTTEITTEALFEAAASVIPGIGEIVDVVMLIVMVAEFFSSIHKNHLKDEHIRAKVLKGGTYHLPLPISIYTHANDLNGKKDVVSFMFFTKRKINSNDIKKYLADKKLTNYVGKTLPLSQFSNDIRYTFSSFDKTHVVENVPARRTYHVPVSYGWRLPNIRLDIIDNKLNILNQSLWSHSLNFKHTLEFPATHVTDGGDRIDEQYILNTSAVYSFNDVVEPWLAYQTKGKLVNIEKLPENVISYEEVNDELAIRINNYNISAHSGKGNLFITLKTTFFDPLNKHVIPENWNPTENTPNNFTYKLTHTTSLSSNTISHRAMDDPNIYPNTKNLPPPPRKQYNLLYFRIHDYQPTHNDLSKIKLTKNNKIDKINHSPIIYNSVDTFNGNQKIVTPAINKSNLHFEIPNTIGPIKDIKYIEITTIKNPYKIIVELIKDTNNEKKYTLNGYFNSTNSFKQNLDIVILDKVASNKNSPNKLQPIGGNVLEFNEDTHEFRDFLLLNTPIQSGEAMNINTYYYDGSHSKQVVKLNVPSNNILNRAYYEVYTSNDVNDNKFYLNKSSNSLSLERISASEINKMSSWLIEHQFDGLYAIMDKTSKKTIGIIEGKLGLYDWNANEHGLFWRIKSTANKIKLFNIIQNAYLYHQNNSNGHNLIYNFDESTTFNIKKVSNAEKIFQDQDKWLYNLNENMVVGLEDEKVKMKPKYSVDHYNDAIDLIYSGCLTYYIKHKKNNSYLYYTSDFGIFWHKSKGINFRINKKDDDSYFNLIYKGFHISNSLSNADRIYLDTTKNQKLDHPKSQFSLIEANRNDYLLAHYTFDESASDKENHFGGELSNPNIIYIDDATRGKVIYLDGVDDYVNTTFTYNPTKYQGFTVSMWIKSHDIKTRVNPFISSYNWQFFSNKDENILSLKSHRLDAKNTIHNSISERGVSEDGNWQFLVMSIDIDENDYTVKQYIDGSIIKKEKIKGKLINKDISTIIGRSFLTSISPKVEYFSNVQSTFHEIPDDSNLLIDKYFKGMIDDVKLWSVALTGDDIKNEYLNSYKEEKIANALYASDFNSMNEFWSFNIGNINGVTGIYNSSYIKPTQKVMSFSRSTIVGTDPIAKADIKIDISNKLVNSNLYFSYASRGNISSNNTGVYFSDDNGKSFTKVYSNFNSQENELIQLDKFNIVEQAKKHNISLLKPIIIRFQHQISALNPTGIELLNVYINEDLPNSINGQISTTDNIFFTAYPNPIIDNIYMDYLSDKDIDISIKFYNSQGDLVKDIPQQLKRGLNKITLNNLKLTGAFAKNDVYIMKIFSSDGFVLFTERLFFN